MQENRQKEKKYSKKTMHMALILVICCMVGMTIYDTYFGRGYLKGMFVQSDTRQTMGKDGLLGEIPLDAGSASAFAVFDESFLLCTKDGAKYYQSIGDQKWSDTFNMTAPRLIQEGSYMAVGDINGKQVRVYHTDKIAYQVQLEGNLQQFALNTNGYLSLIESKDGHSEIKIYSNLGTLLKGRVEESAGVHPISTDISDDNKAFAVSYADLTDVAPMGRVLFFYIGTDESENYTDSLFASVDRPNELVGTISYRSNGTLAVVSESGLYGLRDSFVSWEYPLNNMLEYISFQNKDRIVFALGDALQGKSGEPSGTVCWINSGGKQEGSLHMEHAPTYLGAWEDGMIIGSRQTLMGVRYSGKEEWHIEAMRKITDAIPMEVFHHVLMVGIEDATIYDITKYQAGSVGLMDSEENTKEHTKPDAQDVKVEAEKQDSKTTSKQNTEQTEKNTDSKTQNNTEQKDKQSNKKDGKDRNKKDGTDQKEPQDTVKEKEQEKKEQQPANTEKEVSQTQGDT